LYDVEQTANPIARWSRIRSLQALRSAFQPGETVLELGCGTGEEALHLARLGLNVVATDAAPGMIAQLEGKLSRADNLVGRVTPLVLPAARVGQLTEIYGIEAFDGAYSSFGPLNCEPSLQPVARGLSKLIKPGGRVVLSLINRYCLWETAWYLAARRPRLAFRRWRGVSDATVRAAWQHERITIFYWTPATIERAFTPYFRTTRRMALPWLLPPQYLDGLVRRKPRLFKWLARTDSRLASRWPFYALGDHVLLEMKRLR
jgi:SAM-dependent methyltransferase